MEKSLTAYGGLYFVYQCDFYYRREAYIRVFARVNSWMNEWNRKKRYLPSTLRRESVFSLSQCLVSYRFLSISDTCVWVGWWIVWNEMVVVTLEKKRVHRRNGRFFGDIFCLYREERTIVFIVKIVEEWYKWWNFVTICVFCECGIEQRYYRSLSKMGYEWNGEREREKKSRIIIYCIDT